MISHDDNHHHVDDNNNDTASGGDTEAASTMTTTIEVKSPSDSSRVDNIENNNNNHTNIIIVHPTNLNQDCYRNEEIFKQSMNNCVDLAASTSTASYSSNQSIVDKEFKRQIIIFPEMIGTWLICLNEQPFTFWIPSQLLAIIFIAFSNIIQFIRFFIIECWIYFYEIKRLTNLLSFVTWEGIIYRSTFKMKSQTMFNVYIDTFSEIAINRNAYVVAGSIYLPKIEYNHQYKRLINHDGFYNQSIVFDPRGNICHISIKAFPSEDEHYILSKQKDRTFKSNDFTFEIEDFGRVSVLIGYDSWYPNCYPTTTNTTKTMTTTTTATKTTSAATIGDKQQEIDVIPPKLVIVPLLSSPSKLWKESWQGFQDNAPLPTDFEEFSQHLNNSTSLSDLWKGDGAGLRIFKQAKQHAKSLTSKHSSYFITCQMTGKMWSLSANGESFIRDSEKVLLETNLNGFNISVV